MSEMGNGGHYIIPRNSVNYIVLLQMVKWGMLQWA